jgi:hypothetical protein
MHGANAGCFDWLPPIAELARRREIVTTAPRTLPSPSENGCCQSNDLVQVGVVVDRTRMFLRGEHQMAAAAPTPEVRQGLWRIVLIG